MARRRREPSPSSIKLRHPDRSGPSEKTLLELAQERGLFDQAKKREEEIGKKAAPIRIPRPRKDDSDEEEDEDDDDEVGLTPGAERVLETLLWTMSLAMLHFTLDVLVYHQYSVDRISWPNICQRFAQAFLGKLVSSLLTFLRETLLTLVLFVSSLRSPHLLPPSSRRESRTCPGSVSTIPSRPPTNHILCNERLCRLLPDSHHQHCWLLGRHETGAAAWLHMGVVRHRIGSSLGCTQSRRGGSVPLAEGIQHQIRRGRGWEVA